MTRAPKRLAAAKSATIGEAEDRLNSLYDRFSLALRNPPPGQLDKIVDVLNTTEWCLNQIIIQGLHHDAAILGKLSTQLKDPTDQLVKLKDTLTELAQVAAFGAALLNTIASVLPLL